MLSCCIHVLARSCRPCCPTIVCLQLRLAPEALALNIRILHCGRLSLNLPAAAGQRQTNATSQRSASAQHGCRGGGGQHPPLMHPLNSSHDTVPSGKAAYGSKEPVTQAAEANHRKICDIHVLEQVHAFAGTCMNSATRRIQCMQSCRRTWLAQRARSDGRMDAHQIVVSGSSVALVAYTMQQQRCNCHKYVAAELPNEGATADLQHSNLWP